MEEANVFAESINASNISVNCTNCGVKTIIRFDADSFWYDISYVVLCDTCLLLEKSNSNSEKLVHVIKMVTNSYDKVGGKTCQS